MYINKIYNTFISQKYGSVVNITNYNMPKDYLNVNKRLKKWIILKDKKDKKGWKYIIYTILIITKGWPVH